MSGRGSRHHAALATNSGGAHTRLSCVLAETNGDKRAAARILGVSVRTLQRKIPSFLQASE
jgi:transcriptional regulator with PAS, ATPase and Fis domain